MSFLFVFCFVAYAAALNLTVFGADGALFQQLLNVLQNDVPGVCAPVRAAVVDSGVVFDILLLLLLLPQLPSNDITACADTVEPLPSSVFVLPNVNFSSLDKVVSRTGACVNFDGVLVRHN